jgi:hypothetical protein
VVQSGTCGQVMRLFETYMHLSLTACSLALLCSNDIATSLYARKISRAADRCISSYVLRRSLVPNNIGGNRYRRHIHVTRRLDGGCRVNTELADGRRSNAFARYQRYVPIFAPGRYGETVQTVILSFLASHLSHIESLPRAYHTRRM